MCDHPRVPKKEDDEPAIRKPTHIGPTSGIGRSSYALPSKVNPLAKNRQGPYVQENLRKRALKQSGYLRHEGNDQEVASYTNTYADMSLKFQIWDRVARTDAKRVEDQEELERK